MLDRRRAFRRKLEERRTLRRAFDKAVRASNKTAASAAKPKKNKRPRLHCSLAYSALACFRMGMSGSASFQRVRKSL
jgi:hypothetical protein